MIGILDKRETVWLKALAITLVIAGHLFGKTIGNSADFVILWNLMGTGGVCLFLVLSGYGLFMSYTVNGIGDMYWNKKINKIFLPYWISTIFYVVAIRKNISSIILMKNLLCIDFERTIDGTMWYMSLIVIEYILFWLIFRVKTFDIVKIFFMFLTGIVVRDLAINLVFANCSWQFMNNYLSFSIGILFGWLSNSQRISGFVRDSSLFKLTGVVAGSVLYFFVIKIYPNSFQWSGIIFSIVSICMILLLRSHLANKIGKVLYVIGNNSFILYLLEGKMLDVIPKYYFEEVPVLSIGIYCLLLGGFAWGGAKMIKCIQKYEDRKEGAF